MLAITRLRNEKECTCHMGMGAWQTCSILFREEHMDKQKRHADIIIIKLDVTNPTKIQFRRDEYS